MPVQKLTTAMLTEFLEENVKDLVGTMPWMKEKKMDLCRNMNQLKEFIDRIIQKGICALDTETTGLNTRVDANGKPYIKTVGISLAIDAIEGIYIPMNHTCDPELNLPEKEVWKEIDRLCKNSVTIFHNAKYDIAVLKNEGVIVDDFEKYEDTLLMAYLFDAGQKGIGLKDLSDKLLGQPMIDFDKITGGSGKFNIISPEIGYVYAASDAICTFGLYEYFLKQKTFLDQKAVYNLEKRIVFVVMQMEANLVNIDKEYLIEEKARIAIKLEDIKKEVITLAGEDFNVASTQQLGHILFDKLKYRYPEREKTKSGQYKTDTATLEKIEDEYPIVKKLIQFRTLEKILGTYIENLINNCDENNCVKLGFKQTGTETGRFSCPGGFGLLIDGYSAVNVQSIPANYDETIPDVRRAFRARKGFKIVAMDFSGEELRVAANLSKEKKWLDEFLYGEADLHTVSAMTVYKKEREDVTKLDRKTGKCVAKGTLIASECGWIPIENLKVGDRVITRSGELKEIDKIWNMGIKPGVLIETKSGQKITCGRNHRFLSINDEDWIKAEDMVVGTKIKTANCNKINPQESKKVNFNVWNKGNNNLISKNLPIIEISPLWARLMGYVLGDGSAYKESVNVVCSDEYEDVKEDIFETAKKLGLDPKITKSIHRKINGEYGHWLYHIQLGSRMLVRFFNQVGFTSGRRSGVKDDTNKYKSTKIFRIPGIIFESPKHISKEFLSGLFETDGTVGPCEISVTTKDKELAEDIVLLLASFGIRAYILLHYSKKYNRDYYKVTMGLSGSKTFYDQIGFISKKKTDRLKVLVERYNKSTRSNVTSVKWDTEVKLIQYIDSVELMDLTIRGDDPSYVAQGLISHNTVNFLVMYGGGPRGLSEQAHISENESRRMLTAFFEGLPQLNNWMKKERSIAKEKKFARTALGRIRPLHMFYNSGDRGQEAHADRCAINFLVQGLSADIMKTAMVRVFNWIKNNNFEDEVKMIITVHDEIVFEIREDKLSEHIPALNEIMCLSDVLQGLLKWPVPLELDAEYGDTWHVTNNFFEEHPELKNSSPDIKFHGQNQIPTTPVIPESSKVETEQKTEIASTSTETEQKTEIASTSTETVTEVPPPVEVIKEIDGAATETISNEITIGTPEELIYQVNKLTDVTSRKLNDILDFLDKENDSGLYTSEKKILKLCNKDGSELLVSDVSVFSDAFLALAHYEGL